MKRASFASQLLKRQWQKGTLQITRSISIYNFFEFFLYHI